MNDNYFKQHEGIGNIPPVQARSKIVHCKDWNDIFIPEGKLDLDYEVSQYRRRSVNQGVVIDATLKPIENK